MIQQRHHEHGITELIIDGPPVNAIDLAGLAELTALIRSAPDSPSATVLVISAAGPGFSAGGDVKEIVSLPGFEGILGQVEGSLELTLAMIECPLPIIVSVHGYCIGLGVLIAASADIVMCADGTTFTLAEVDNGATTGVVQALALMPDKMLRAAMLTGEPVAADVLQRTGGVHTVVPRELLPERSLALAQSIGLKGAPVLRALKGTFRGSASPDVRALYRQEMSHTYALNMRGQAAAIREKSFARIT